MMTPKEALRKLEVYSSTNGSGQCTQDEHEEAKKMAMAALEKLQHYEELKTAGRLVELPCKVGDTVYFLNTKPHISLRMNWIYKSKVARIVTIGSGSFIMIQMRTEYGCTELPAVRCDFGKTVFLAREEAEAALKGSDLNE